MATATDERTGAHDAPPLARETDPGGAAWRAAVAGAAAGVSFLLVAWLLPRANFLGCGDGLDSLGCAFAMVLLAQGLALVGSGLVGAAVLAALRARAPLSIGLAGALSAGALWPVTRALSTSRAMAFVVVGAAYVVMYVLHSTFRVRPEGLRVVVTLVLAFYAFQALEPVGAKVDSELYERKEVAEVERVVTWQVHEPSVLPRGFALHETRLMDIGPQPDMYRWEYLYSDNVDNDRGVVTVRSFRAEHGHYRPPGDCGWPYPSDPPSRPFRCGQVGTMPTGEPIYQWEHSNVCGNGCATYFVLLGGTLTAVEADWALRPAEALPMIRSLRAVPKERLVQLVRD